MRINSFLGLIVLTFALTAVCINSSFALKELNISTPDLARSSVDIVVAKCISSEAKIDEKTGLIFTYTTFQIDENLKGKYGDELVLRIVGGTVGDVTVSSPYLPAFKQGEEVVLFLGKKNSDGYPLLKSLNKGIYRVSTDNTGNRVINSRVSGLPIYSSRTDQRIVNSDRLTLDDFIYSLQNVL